MKVAFGARVPSSFAALLLAGVLASGLLGGCGFHLRGAVTLPPQMTETRIVGTPLRGPLGESLAAAVTRGGGRVVSEVDEASSVLRITRERFDRRVLSVGADRKASEYELNYLVAFELVDPDGGVLVPEQTVNVTRDYTFDPGSVLGKSDEEELLRREMLALAVRQVMRRLNAAGRLEDGRPDAGGGPA